MIPSDDRPAEPDTSADRSSRPTVTVVMPVRNEEAFIDAAVRSVLDQDYPAALLDIVVAEGSSTDRTRAILERIVADEPRVRIVDNPEQIVSTGLNRAIAQARGEIIIRIDGHCDIDRDFVRASAEVLAEHPEAWVVGGPIRHAATTAFGRAVAHAMSSPAGVGGASHRFEGYEGYSDSAQFPAFRRTVFDRVGTFDVAQVRNQDDELNFRITQAGGKIYVSPRIGYRYYVRERPRQLFRQYYQYAFWRIPMLRKHRRPTTVRQLIPPLFYLTMAVGVVAGLVLRKPRIAFALPAAYGGVLAAVGVHSLGTLDPAAAARVPAAVAILHASYASGWAVGFWSTAFRPDAWSADGSMSALSR